MGLPLRHDPKRVAQDTEEQKRIGWEKAVRIEKMLCTILREAHERQVQETMDTLSEGPEGFYGRVPKPPRDEGGG